MKFADRLKFTAAGTSAASITVGTAVPGFRTPAKVIADADSPLAVGDTNVAFTVSDGSGNWETSYYTLTTSSQLTRSRVYASSNSGAAVTFDANGLTVFNTITGEQLAGGVANPDDVGYDIILLIGQSNMAGRGAVDTYADVSNSRVFQYGGDANNANTHNKIVQAVDPLSHAENGSTAGTGVGPGMPFARRYAASLPSNRMALLVPYAVGSTALVNGPWAANAGSNYLTQAVAQMQAAKAAADLWYPNNRYSVVLWAQGEQDANSGVSTAAYDAALQALISYVRTTLGVPNLPFMIHGMNPDYVATLPAYQVIQTALQNVATEVDHCMFVAGSTGATYDNGVHYTSAGYRILGSKSASLVPAARRYVAPVVPASALTLGLSSASVVTGSPTTVTVGVDHPLTGSQSETVTLAAPMTGAWSVGTSVTLNAGTQSVAQTFTPSATGSGNITASASGTPTLTAASTSFASTAAPTETLTVNTPATQTAGTAFTVSGTYANVTPTALDYSLDGGTTWTAASSPTISGGNYSFGGVTVASANASQTVKVRDHNNTGVTATSAAFTVSATPVETLTVNTPATQTVGVAYNVTGTYANGTPTALDYSIDGGTTWTAAASPTISGGTYSFSVTPSTSSASRTMMVRDHNNTGVTATSGTYIVNASGGTFATWNPADKSTNVVLTNGNLTADGGGGTAAWQGVRANIGKSAGKWYWEIHIDASSTGIMVGVADTTEAFTNYIGNDAHGFGYYGSSGALFGTGKSAGSSTAFGVGAVIGVALDMDAGTMSFYKNGALQFGGAAFTGLTGTLYPAISPHSGAPSEKATANFGATAFAYTPPSGFVGVS